MNTAGITVCIGYADTLELTLTNAKLFDRWVIVTTKHDHKTQALCKDRGLEYILTDRVYDGGARFAKGRAINDAIDYLAPKDWVVLVDADTYVFVDTLKHIWSCSNMFTDCLYSVCGRYLVKDRQEFEDFLKSDKNVKTEHLTHVGWMVGFFQMWHSSHVYYYPEESQTAGLDDILMRDNYPKNKWCVFPSYAVHIGEMWVNHNGKDI